jgi:8-oxo-dGTP pyrophosphatase MutT (NUDIX family)
MSDQMKDLLLRDYDHLSRFLERNEQVGETRINLFTGLVTAVAGALAGLFAREVKLAPGSLRWIVLSALVALLVIGIAVLFRMLVRNSATDKTKLQLDVIRDSFREQFDPADKWLGHNPFPGADRAIAPRKLGGLAHMTAVLNSLVCAAIAAVSLVVFVLPLDRRWVAVLAAMVVFGLALLAQHAYIAAREKEAQKALRLDLGGATHGGGVVYCQESGDVRYLLIPPKNAKNSSSEWVLPKGHIKPFESARLAAQREVREECGIDASVERFLAYVRFENGGQVVAVKFYLMTGPKEPKLRSERNPEWVAYEDALARLKKVPESCAVLCFAEQVRRKLHFEQTKIA